MKTLVETDNARISIVETPDSFKIIKKFEGYSYDTVKNMTYAYIKRVLEPLNLYHHRPEIWNVQDKYFSKVISYGNVKVVDKDGKLIYESSGLNPPDCPKENSTILAPIHSIPGIEVKIEDKNGKKITVNEPSIEVKSRKAPKKKV